MSSLSSLSRAVSGLMSNQQALNTTAHNLTNVDTPGYVRQQVLMVDANYITKGSSATSLSQVGLGTDVQAIRQVRDRFLDLAFRDENSRLGFYESQANSIAEIENIIGETEGEAFSQILNDMWVSLSELSKNPEGLETRGSFIQNASLFVEKANLIGQQLEEYQTNLNEKISSKVERVNEIGLEIQELNNIIATKEASGGNANDYRDARNSLVDELSYMVDIRTNEDFEGNLLVSIENVPFVTVGEVWQLGVVQSEDFSNLVDPYWPHLSEAGPPFVAQKLFNFDNPVGPQYDNNKGELKGLIMSRGTRTANHFDLENQTSYEEDIEPSSIMTAQAQFDKLVNGIVTMINGVLSPTVADGASPSGFSKDPNGPYGMNDSSNQGIELFSRIYMDRFDASGYYMEEDASNDFSLYSPGNIEINPEILVNYNKLTISSTFGVDADSSKVEELIAKWQEPFSTLSPSSSGELDFNEYYNSFVSELGNRGSAINSQVGNQEVLALQIDNQRNQLMGVSTDEELGNMIMYQHAYNASAKVVNVLDEMMGRVIDQTGLVGR